MSIFMQPNLYFPGVNAVFDAKEIINKTVDHYYREQHYVNKFFY